MADYITVNEISSGEYSEKHSRFIATLYPVESEQDAADLLAAHKAKYFDARHNVYAYILHNNTARFSDDGEPHGTAGKPLLDVLYHSGITDALLVCTRYFGGILLGTGGLVRAYSTAAKEAIKNASPVTMTECGVFSINMPYSEQGAVMSFLTDMNAFVLDTEFTDTVSTEFAIPKSETERFHKKLCEISSGKLTAVHKFDRILPINAKKQRSF